MIHLLRQALYAAPKEGEPVPPGFPTLSVEGRDPEGMLLVVLAAGEQAFRLRVPDLPALVSLAGPPLKTTRSLTEEQLPFRSRTFPAREVSEAAFEGAVSRALLTGAAAQSQAKVESVKGERLAGATFTCRGPTQEAQGVEYKSFNEDGAVVRLRRRNDAGKELLGLGVFDQAGGEGQIEGRPGAASDVAARAFEAALTEVETGKPPREALEASVQRANEGVKALGVGAITTFAAAIAIETPTGAEVHGAVIGDSRVLHVSAEGKIIAASDQHNLGKAVFSGLVDEIPPPLALRFAAVLTRSVGSDTCDPDYFHWQLAPGERLVLESDGLGDARELEEMPDGVWHADRCAAEQARIAAKAANAADAVNSLIGYALDQMADGYGKPDNVTVGVIQLVS